MTYTQNVKWNLSKTRLRYRPTSTKESRIKLLRFNFMQTETAHDFDYVNRKSSSIRYSKNSLSPNNQKV